MSTEESSNTSQQPALDFGDLLDAYDVHNDEAQSEGQGGGNTANSGGDGEASSMGTSDETKPVATTSEMPANSFQNSINQSVDSLSPTAGVAVVQSMDQPTAGKESEVQQQESSLQTLSRFVEELSSPRHDDSAGGSTLQPVEQQPAVTIQPTGIGPQDYVFVDSGDSEIVKLSKIVETVGGVNDSLNEETSVEEINLHDKSIDEMESMSDTEVNDAVDDSNGKSLSDTEVNDAVDDSNGKSLSDTEVNDAVDDSNGKSLSDTEVNDAVDDSNGKSLSDTEVNDAVDDSNGKSLSDTEVNDAVDDSNGKSLSDTEVNDAVDDSNGKSLSDTEVNDAVDDSNGNSLSDTEVNDAVDDSNINSLPLNITGVIKNTFSLSSGTDGVTTNHQPLTDSSQGDSSGIILDHSSSDSKPSGQENMGEINYVFSSSKNVDCDNEKAKGKVDSRRGSTTGSVTSSDGVVTASGTVDSRRLSTTASLASSDGVVTVSVNEDGMETFHCIGDDENQMFSFHIENNPDEDSNEAQEENGGNIIEEDCDNGVQTENMSNNTPEETDVNNHVVENSNIESNETELHLDTSNTSNSVTGVTESPSTIHNNKTDDNTADDNSIESDKKDKDSENNASDKGVLSVDLEAETPVLLHCLTSNDGSKTDKSPSGLSNTVEGVDNADNHSTVSDTNTSTSGNNYGGTVSEPLNLSVQSSPGSSVNNDDIQRPGSALSLTSPVTTAHNSSQEAASSHQSNYAAFAAASAAASSRVNKRKRKDPVRSMNYAHILPRPTESPTPPNPTAISSSIENNQNSVEIPHVLSAPMSINPKPISQQQQAQQPSTQPLLSTAAAAVKEERHDRGYEGSWGMMGTPSHLPMLPGDVQIQTNFPRITNVHSIHNPLQQQQQQQQANQAMPPTFSNMLQGNMTLSQQQQAAQGKIPRVRSRSKPRPSPQPSPHQQPPPPPPPSYLNSSMFNSTSPLGDPGGMRPPMRPPMNFHPPPHHHIQPINIAPEGSPHGYPPGPPPPRYFPPGGHPSRLPHHMSPYNFPPGGSPYHFRQRNAGRDVGARPYFYDPYAPPPHHFGGPPHPMPNHPRPTGHPPAPQRLPQVTDNNAGDRGSSVMIHHLPQQRQPLVIRPEHNIPPPRPPSNPFQQPSSLMEQQQQQQHQQAITTYQFQVNKNGFGNLTSVTNAMNNSVHSSGSNNSATTDRPLVASPNSSATASVVTSSPSLLNSTKLSLDKITKKNFAVGSIRDVAKQIVQSVLPKVNIQHKTSIASSPVVSNNSTTVTSTSTTKSSTTPKTSSATAPTPKNTTTPSVTIEQEKNRISSEILKEQPIPTYKPKQPPASLGFKSPMKTYKCQGCGDEFLFSTSLVNHLERKTMLITYNCEECHKSIAFYNRCCLFVHAKSHAKGAKAYRLNINLAHIKVLPEDMMPSIGDDAEGRGVTGGESPVRPESTSTDSPLQSKAAPVIIRQSPSSSVVVRNAKTVSIVKTNEKSQAAVKKQLIGQPILIPSAVAANNNNTPISIAPKPAPKPASYNPNFFTVIHAASKKRLYKCMECKRTYNTLAMYKNHFNGKMSKTPGLFKCSKCLTDVVGVCASSAHMRVHSKESPYVCPECGEFISGKRVLFLKHLKQKCIHFQKTLLMRCTICNSVVLFDPETVAKHYMEMHYAKYYKCLECPMAFKTAETFGNHKKSSHGNKAEHKLICKCALCDTVFHKMDNVQDHFKNQHWPDMSKHSCFTAFKCTQCAPQKLFNNRNAYSYHMKKLHDAHIVEEMCNACGAEFNTEAAMKLHRLKVHGDSDTSGIYIAQVNAPTPSSVNSQLNSSNSKKQRTSSAAAAGGGGVTKEKAMIINEDSNSNPDKTIPEIDQKSSSKSIVNNKTDGKNHVNNNNNKKASKEAKVYDCKRCSTIFRDESVYEKHMAKHKFVEKKFVEKRKLMGEKIPSLKIKKLKVEDLSVSHSFKIVNPDYGNDEDGQVEAVEQPKEIPTEEHSTKRKTEKFISQVPTAPLPKPRHKCSECDEKFFSIDDLQEHLKMYHGISPQFPCHLCGNTYDSKDLTERHIQIVHEGKSKDHAYLCWICLETHNQIKGFSSWKGLEKHLTGHHKLHKNNIDYSRFPRLANGDADSDSVASKKSDVDLEDNPVKKLRLANDQMFSCAKCKYQSDNRTEFVQHVSKHRLDDSDIQCLECGLCFAVLPSLKRHLFMVHRIRDFKKYQQDTGIDVNSVGGGGGYRSSGGGGGSGSESGTPQKSPCKSHVSQIPNGIAQPNLERMQKRKEVKKAPEPEEANPLECNVCYKIFENDAALRKHMRMHGMAFIRSRRTQVIAWE